MKNEEVKAVCLREKKIDVDAESPFASCKLKREPYAQVLTSIVGAYNDGFVLAVNGKWGTGKSTFMNMWRRSLINDGYTTILYNAWENDFTTEPMVGILGEIRSLVTNENQADYDRIATKAAKFSGKIIPALLKMVLSMSGLGVIGDAAEKFSETTIDTFQSEVDEYDNKKESLQSLRKELSDFIKKNCNDKPLVFIVDELDRCRPDYAVEVLEKIKHFFTVEGVVFVLSIDKKQLGHAIEGHYGSAEIDSSEYLRRFIDLEYTLPEPNYSEFIEYLYEKYQLADFFEQKNSEGRSEDKLDKKAFFSTICAYSKKNNITLRQLEKTFARLRVLIFSFSKKDTVNANVLFMLIVFREFRESIYSLISKRNSPVKEILVALDIELGYFTADKDKTLMYMQYEYTIAMIAKLYCNEISVEFPINYADGEPDLIFTLDHTDTKKIAKLMMQHDSGDGVHISHYTKKIDLLENFKS